MSAVMELDWAGLGRPERPTGPGLGTKGVEKNLWQGKVGSRQEQNGKLMRGDWADSSSGCLSFRQQLLANAELIWGRQLSIPGVSKPLA